MYTWNFSFLAYLFPPKTLYGTLQLWSIEEVDAYLLTQAELPFEPKFK